MLVRLVTLSTISTDDVRTHEPVRAALGSTSTRVRGGVAKTNCEENELPTASCGATMLCRTLPLTSEKLNCTSQAPVGMPGIATFDTLRRRISTFALIPARPKGGRYGMYALGVAAVEGQPPKLLRAVRTAGIGRYAA